MVCPGCRAHCCLLLGPLPHSSSSHYIYPQLPRKTFLLLSLQLSLGSLGSHSTYRQFPGLQFNLRFCYGHYVISFNYIYLFIMCVHAYTCHSSHVALRGQLARAGSFLPSCGSLNQTQVGRCLYLMSRVIGSFVVLFFDPFPADFELIV